MTSFTTLTAVAAPVPQPNVDTDVIMPKQFLKTIDRSGLARGVFHDIRFTPDGQTRPEFILNQAPWSEARILVTGPNFGCGSSREHAVWGLWQLGIRAIIGTSFAGIFFDNCAQNGILVVTLPEREVATLLRTVAVPDSSSLTIDLPAQEIRPTIGGAIRFDIDPLRKRNLIEGLDPIGLTLTVATDIHRFEQDHFTRAPWSRISLAPSTP